MAVKYAVANGNWSAGTTWNDGSIPQADDDVYANNHTVTINVATLVVGSINTIANSDYGIVQGGAFTCSVPTSISATRNCDLRDTTSSTGGVMTYQGNTNAYCYFNAPKLISNTTNGVFSHTFGNNTGWIFVGNIELLQNGMSLAYLGGGGIHKLIINGNVYGTGRFFYVKFTATAGNWEVLINGNVSGGVADPSVISRSFNIVINGNKHYFINEYDDFSTGGNCTINGNVTYEATNGKAGIDLNHTTILNPLTFTWKDVTQPRSNPFIILTDAEMNNRQQYPPENEVKEGSEYVWGEKVGTYQQPPESVVLKDYVYDNGEKIGSLENQNIVGCVTPEDVRKDVPLVGMGVVGSLVVPSADDVREGVVFDNGSVGTLIVEGGGDRLRIADFGYYTRSTSITYIVDLTESDKPAFADCEEIVLLSLFPTLDLNNIPDKFFDDLFVQFLRYRLLVEYYRGTSINSKFTPSEPTSEIVNYANTKCEYWLNTANLFLQLWGEKYPNSVKRDRILL